LRRHHPGLRAGHGRRKQTLDLTLVQWRQVDGIRFRQRGRQVAPAGRQRWRADRQRVGGRIGASGQQHAQRRRGDPPERERQGSPAACVQPLDVIDRDQHRPGIQA
jgi:hypothetical protein